MQRIVEIDGVTHTLVATDLNDNPYGARVRTPFNWRAAAKGVPGVVGRGVNARKALDDCEIQLRGRAK